MISKQVIQSLYSKYKKLPESPDFLNIPLLFDCATEHHNVSIDMDGPLDCLVINSVEPNSPFHRVPLERIHAIVPFEEWIAIVLHSSIIFLDKKSPKVNVHLKMPKETLGDRLRRLLSKEDNQG